MRAEVHNCTAGGDITAVCSGQFVTKEPDDYTVTDVIVFILGLVLFGLFIQTMSHC